VVGDAAEDIGELGLRVDAVELGAGSDAGGKRAATIYTILQTAALNSLNPEAYLREVLASLPDHPINQIDQLLP
jgi:transposase